MDIGGEIRPRHQGLYLARIPLIDRVVLGVRIARIYLPFLLGTFFDVLYGLLIGSYYPALAPGLYRHVRYCEPLLHRELPYRLAFELHSPVEGSIDPYLAYGVEYEVLSHNPGPGFSVKDELHRLGYPEPYLSCGHGVGYVGGPDPG